MPRTISNRQDDIEYYPLFDIEGTRRYRKTLKNRIINTVSRHTIDEFDSISIYRPRYISIDFKAGIWYPKPLFTGHSRLSTTAEGEGRSYSRVSLPYVSQIKGTIIEHIVPKILFKTE